MRAGSLAEEPPDRLQHRPVLVHRWGCMGKRAEPATPGSPTGEGLPSLFARERVPMVRLATLLVGSVPAAEDVVQDAFGEVTRRWGELERPGAYLRTCVVNGSRAALRRRTTEARSHALVPPAPDVELPARLIELRDALEHLGERQRVVVVLRYFVDLPDHEIAREIGCRPSTVRSLARRALATLRKELG
jgi:RNA polymerase sigma factor (sigma-70 family)